MEIWEKIMSEMQKKGVLLRLYDILVFQLALNNGKMFFGRHLCRPKSLADELLEKNWKEIEVRSDEK